MTPDLWVQLIQTVLPTIILVFGGQWLLSRYELAKTAREQEIELARSIRQQQYQAVSDLFILFGKLMELYRDVNGSQFYPEDDEEHQLFLKRANKIESRVDALILRISCEFAVDQVNDLEELLGHMRQATQVWRESIRDKQKLPFNFSHQPDYARFKETFAGVAAYMVHKIHGGLAPPKMRIDEAKDLLANVFSNKYEHASYSPKQDQQRWVQDVVELKCKSDS